jgi:hypothetical protein
MASRLVARRTACGSWLRLRADLTPDPNGTLTAEWTTGLRTVTGIVGRRTWGLFAQHAGRTAWRAGGGWPLPAAPPAGSDRP